jgi:murein DD-endopeptidase MepM/ murein hydrolase activator NlpD
MFRALLFLSVLLFVKPSFALELKGPLTQGGLIVGKTLPDANVFLDEKKILVDQNGMFVMGFGRDYKETAMLKIKYSDGKTVVKDLNISPREYEVQKIDGLPSDKVTPPEAVWDRINADRKLVAKARNNESKNSYYLEGFVKPSEGIVSGVYGSQRILNGIPKQPHYGIDYAAPLGAPVIAPASGTVTLAHKDMYYTGGTVIIDHGYGVSSTLMHLNVVNVENGQEVKQGDVIGEVGQSGRATGPHLDWRVNWYNERVDPALVLSLFDVSN